MVFAAQNRVFSFPLTPQIVLTNPDDAADESRFDVSRWLDVGKDDGDVVREAGAAHALGEPGHSECDAVVECPDSFSRLQILPRERETERDREGDRDRDRERKRYGSTVTCIALERVVMVFMHGHCS